MKIGAVFAEATDSGVCAVPPLCWLTKSRYIVTTYWAVIGHNRYAINQIHSFHIITAQPLDRCEVLT